MKMLHIFTACFFAIIPQTFCAFLFFYNLFGIFNVISWSFRIFIYVLSDVCHYFIGTFGSLSANWFVNDFLHILRVAHSGITLYGIFLWMLLVVLLYLAFYFVAYVYYGFFFFLYFKHLHFHKHRSVTMWWYKEFRLVLNLQVLSLKYAMSLVLLSFCRYSSYFLVFIRNILLLETFLYDWFLLWLYFIFFILTTFSTVYLFKASYL